MDEQGAVDALERLGLSTYEARVFIGLVALGVGTASDVADVVDVPRSQVYGAAERLESRGLVVSRRASPIEYRAVGLEEARAQLRSRYERAIDESFGYLERVRERAPAEEQQGVWSVEGAETVSTRLVRLVEDADASALLATERPALVTEAMVDALVAATDRGLAVRVVSGTPAVLAPFAETAVRTRELEQLHDWESHAGRVLVADRDTVLLSVVQGGEETAIWSADSAFASVFVRLIEGRLEMR